MELVLAMTLTSTCSVPSVSKASKSCRYWKSCSDMSRSFWDARSSIDACVRSAKGDSMLVSAYEIDFDTS